MKRKNNTNVLTFILLLFVCSCKSQKLLPGFSIGMSEQETKEKIKGNIDNGTFKKSSYSDSTTFIFNWKLLDSAIYATVSFNNDGVYNGDLRICVIDINDSNRTKKIHEPYDVAKTNILKHEDIFCMETGETESIISYSTCPVSKFNMTLQFLQQKFGKEDSITYQINKNIEREKDWDMARLITDTFYYNYHFHDDNSQIVLRRERILKPSIYIPYPHINTAIIYQVSNNYEEELGKIIASKKKELRPFDIVYIPITYKIAKEKDEFGIQETYINMTVIMGGFNRKTSIENRHIDNVKGSICIYDAYGDLLQKIPDIEFDTKNSLKSEKTGLQWALGENMIISEEKIYRPKLRVFSKWNSNELKTAIKNNREIKIKFEPEALIFSDGNVLK